MDEDSFYRECLYERYCAVCGQPRADVHHWDPLGSGRNRRKYDDSGHRKIALCRAHHSEVHNIGRETFAGKYKVRGIIYNG